VNPMIAPSALLAMEAASSGPPANGEPDHLWLWIILGLVGIGLVVAAMAVLARYLRIGINLFLDMPLPVTANLRDFTPPTGETVLFPNREGRTLRGMFIDRPAGTPDRGLILFCHEFGSDMMSAGRYAGALIQAGYTVFTFDFRGHGQSYTPPHFEPRHWPSSHDVSDVLSAIAYVRSRCDLDGRGLGVMGVSRGGGAAICAAALNPHIRCLAVDSAFSTDQSVDELLRRYGQIFLGAKFRRASQSPLMYRSFRTLLMFYGELKCRCRFPSTRRAVGKLEAVPILFIQGNRDTYIREEQTRVLAGLKPGEKELWVCPDAKHNQAVAADPKTYHRKVTEFFDRHMTAPASTGAPAPPASAGSAAG
jgi:uncharacterized protein